VHAVYLDHNATSPPRPAALEAWNRVQRETWANPASTHRPGQRARAIADDARRRCAAVLGCREEELVATSGGTEANVLAIRAAARERPRRPLVVASIDHSSVLRPAAEHPGGSRTVGVDAQARIDPGDLARSCADDPALVCLQHANNVVGTLQDLNALVAAVRSTAPSAHILVDACQTVGKESVRVADWDVDFVSVAGHKLGAPKGVGLCYVRAGTPLAPLLPGGRQQQDRRSGTEDPAGLAALAAALEATVDAHVEERKHCEELIEGCWSRIAADLPEAVRVAAGAPHLGNTCCLAHPGVDAEDLLMRLDLAGFASSRGSACMSGRREPSHVLAAMGLEPGLAASAIRISAGHGNDSDDGARFAEAYVREVRALV